MIPCQSKTYPEHYITNPKYSLIHAELIEKLMIFTLKPNVD